MQHRAQTEQHFFLNKVPDVNNLKVFPNCVLPSECTQQPPFLCRCDSVLSPEEGKAVETKPSHDHSFPKELLSKVGKKGKHK